MMRARSAAQILHCLRGIGSASPCRASTNGLYTTVAINGQNRHSAGSVDVYAVYRHGARRPCKSRAKGAFPPCLVSAYGLCPLLCPHSIKFDNKWAHLVAFGSLRELG